MKPKVTHAGCGGEVEVRHLDINSSFRFIRCHKCGEVIKDPLQLTPRGSDYKSEKDTAARFDVGTL